MSRIGRLPVAIPAGVEVTVAEGNVVTVKGPKGTLERALPTEMEIKVEDGHVVVSRPNDLKKMKSLHGLTRELEEIRRKKNRRTSARRNQERALSMNRAFVAFLTACVAASALVSVSLIQIRSNVTQQMKEVAALESQINDMKADNDARYKQITTSVDLNAIKDAAINRLGMKYASQDQIVYYSVDKNNYMDQYSDIPE